MPSHLTRVVFRSIIANKPLLYRGCLQRSTRPRIDVQHGFRALPQSQRRTFFNMFKPQRKTKETDLPPGLGKMMDMRHLQIVNARPPPTEEIAQAFRDFFKKDRKIEDYHVRHALEAFRHLEKHPREDGQPWLSVKDLRSPMSSLERPPDTGGEAHLELGRLLHQKLNAKLKGDKSDTFLSQDQTNLSKSDISDLFRFTKLLCLYGASLEAKDILEKTFAGPVTSATSRLTVSAWINLLNGFSREDNQEELLRSVSIIETLSVPFVPRMQDILVTFFSRKGDLEQAKHWYLHPVIDGESLQEKEPTGHTYAIILKACALNGDQSFGQQVVASLLKNMPNKEAWDAIFLWSAAIGKGVDEVDRMMKVMVRRNDEWRRADPSHPIVRPDIDTINSLVEFSMSRNDPYSAERYIALGERWDVLPNAKTFIMQMQYRLSVNDIDGARAAYFGLQGEKVEDDESAGIVNKLIRAMCSSKRHPFDDIMAIVEDLHEHKIRFAPETVATLCTLHLRRGEFHDAVDLLQIHAFHFDIDQRAVIRDQLVAFCLDRQNSTAHAWDTYQIFRQVFNETPREIRTKVMNEFFARRRSDMACHVFFHMRNHTSPDINVDRDTYAAAFTGFARNADAESLELIHNQLKLDLNVELDTKLRNSLMLAYAATGNNRRALEFWAEIVASKEGPTYSSIAIAFRSCEGMPWGDEHAKPIWRRLKEMDIDIDKEIFTAYIGALARNGLYAEVVKMVENVEEEYGFTPDLYILGNWFNATINIEKQAKTEEWIKTHYPAVWVELENLGHYITMDGFGYKQFNINRDLDP
ncbi:hypothetical protein K469DRAFT_698725 [Zopfia rhizophila CBS 207.26]|uniref:Complex I intermediate-associated protein-like protein 84 n=1 Tax=Zopfia rhizophila CBS 207.26 TaxID=1314779 RepID=A0A6A6EUC0_9PEZI|nr:hypothetical protein K469DRAFT_698725 [Zopfia rhizophila CBS 207.26]